MPTGEFPWLCGKGLLEGFNINEQDSNPCLAMLSDFIAQTSHQLDRHQLKILIKTSLIVLDTDKVFQRISQIHMSCSTVTIVPIFLPFVGSYVYTTIAQISTIKLTCMIDSRTSHSSISILEVNASFTLTPVFFLLAKVSSRYQTSRR